MPNEKEFLVKLGKAQSAYDEAVKTLPAHAVQKHSAKIKELKKLLSAFLSDGAVPCKCGRPPHGMKKRPAYSDKQGDHLAVYEVGCLACPALSRAGTPEGAVAKWNAL